MGVRKAKAKRGRGRPSEFEGIDLEQVKALARQGKTPPQIADEIGVCPATVYNYANKYPQFLEALTNGKAVADGRVESSLYERALGFECDEQRVSAMGEIVTVRKKYPPDVMAIMFWLKNRKPAEWKEKQEVEHSGSVDLAGLLAAARKRIEPEGGGE